jgi:hypothetical protein
MRVDVELDTRRSTMILHVEHEQSGGPYRITTEQPDTESDLSTMLWQGDPPQSTTLTLAEEQLGYTKYDLTGVHDAESQQLRPDAYEWLSTAQPETYEDSLARRSQEKQEVEARLDAPVPHLGGVTFREVWNNLDQWKGLRESDDWFVWVGWDNGSKIEMWELPDDLQVRKNIRWYVDQGNSLNEAVKKEMQDQFEALKVMVFMLASG